MALQLIKQAKEEKSKILDLRYCRIVGELPEVIGELEWLEELYLGLEFEQLNDGLESDLPIERLLEDPNSISALPNNLPRGLKVLALDGNPISDIAAVASLYNLEKLALGSTKVTDFRPLQSIESLVWLNLWGTEIEDLSPISAIHNLRSLNISKTKVKDLAPISKLLQLEVLDCRSAFFVKSLAPLIKLQFLRELKLDWTSVVNISPIADLINLERLDIASTFISDINCLKNLKRLKVLALENTKIDNFDPISDLHELEKLDLRGSNINDLRPISRLKNLIALNISDTKITDLRPIQDLFSRKDNPLEVYDLFNGAKNVVFLHNCPLTNPPFDIAMKGRDAILRHWKRQDEEAEAEITDSINWHCKLVIVGNGGVGKSTLLEYLKSGKVSNNTQQTEFFEMAEWRPQFDFLQKNSENTKSGKAVVQVFDFGGQDYYHDAHNLFFSSNTAYLVLWSAEKNKLGKEQLKKERGKSALSSFHYPLEYWLDAIRYFNGVSQMLPEEELFTLNFSDLETESGEEYALIVRHVTRDIYESFQQKVSQIPALVVQTHIDKSGIEFLNQASLTKEFPWILDFEAVSLASQKLERIDLVMAKLHDAIGKIPILGAPFSTTYAWVRDAVQSYPFQTTMTKTEFKNWVNTLVIDNHQEAKGRNLEALYFQDAELEDLIGYLGSLSSLLHFPDSPLENKVFLRPELLKATVLELLREMPNQKGFFSKKEALKHLKKASKETEIDDILSLMQEFKMAFQIGHEKDQLWTAPLYLPEEAPEGIDLLLQIFDQPVRRITFRYFIHKSVVLEFFQKHVQDIKTEQGQDQKKSYLVWRNGMVLQSPECGELVLVRFFMGESPTESPTESKPAHIDIFSFGTPKSGKKPAEDVIKSLSEITQNWRVQHEVTIDGQSFIPLSELEKASKAKETHFSFEGKSYLLEDYAAFAKIPWDRLYISYAEEDETFCKAFEKHIWPLQQRDKLIIWSKGQLKAGMLKDEVQQAEMRKANIIVLLLGADYFYDRDIWNVEFKEVMARAERGECQLAVVVVRECDHGATNLAGIKFLNNDPGIGESGNDKAWMEVVRELKNILKSSKESKL